MNPYLERLSDLHQWLECRYGQRDRQATEVLLGALLPREILKAKSPWMVLETDYPSRDTLDGWFSLGGEFRPQPHSLAFARIQRATRCEGILQDWWKDRQAGRPGLFIEAEWRRLPGSGKGATLLMQTHSYGALLATCLRLRVAYPKGDHAARMQKQEDDAELARLTRRVLDCSHRTTVERKSNLPSGFLYWCEMLQKVAPLQTDWESLTGGLATIARSIALLYNDGRPPDWQAAERVMRDCVPWVNEWILGQTALDRGRGIKAYQMFVQSGHTLDKPLVAEIRRLSREGVLLARQSYRSADHYRYHPWRYRLASQDWRTLVNREERILV